MPLGRPYPEQHGALQDEAISMVRDAEAIDETLDGEIREHPLELDPRRPGKVGETRTDGCRKIGRCSLPAHATLSR